MTNKEELLETIGKIKEITKDYNKFVHLFSEDIAVKTMAKLNKLLGTLEFRLKLNDIKEVIHPKNNAIEKYWGGKTGSLVSIRPCDKEYENKTYLGILLGSVSMGSSVTISDGKIQCNWANHNPAIFVPDLGKIIYGCESWWSEIESEEELKQITNEDIGNVWYVKLWKKMQETE